MTLGPKQLLRGLARRVGRDITPYPPSAPLRSLRRIRRRWLRELGVRTVIDVGANTGQYAAEVRAEGFGGRIISFEPLAGTFEKLRAAAGADPMWEAVNCALGREAGEAQIHVSANSESSSLLPMEARHSGADPNSSYVGTETIQMRRLDDLSPPWVADGPIWLKADVQGYEWDVLDGAPRTLDHAVAVEIELSLVPLYTGQPMMPDSVRRMEEQGYTLSALEEVFVHPRTGATLQLAGVFLKQNAVARLEEGGAA